MKAIIAYKRKANSYIIPARNICFKTYDNMVLSYEEGAIFVEQK